jgi:hypothetical protein
MENREWKMENSVYVSRPWKVANGFKFLRCIRRARNVNKTPLRFSILDLPSSPDSQSPDMHRIRRGAGDLAGGQFNFGAQSQKSLNDIRIELGSGLSLQFGESLVHR